MITTAYYDIAYRAVAVLGPLADDPKKHSIPGCPESDGDFIDNLTQCVGEVAGGVVSPVADVSLAVLAKGAAAAFGFMLQLAIEWLRSENNSTAGTDTIRALMTGASTGLPAILATVGLMIAGTKLVLASSRAQETAQDILRGLVILTLVTAGGAIVANEIRQGFDTTAATVIAQAPSSSNIQERISNSTNGATPFLTLLISILGCLTGMVQYVIMLFREPVMALMEGMLPIAAASAMTGMGLQWLKRLSCWILSFAIYKYLAAVIIAAALNAVAQSKDDDKTLLTSLALLTISALALPAMIRLITPVADAVGSGGGGGLLAAAGAAATGAMLLSGRGKGAGAAAAAAEPTAAQGSAAQGAAGLQLPAGTALTAASRTPLPAETAPAIGSGPPTSGPPPSGPPPSDPPNPPSGGPGGPGDGGPRSLPPGTGGGNQPALPAGTGPAAAGASGSGPGTGAERAPDPGTGADPGAGMPPGPVSGPVSGPGSGAPAAASAGSGPNQVGYGLAAAGAGAGLLRWVGDVAAPPGPAQDVGPEPPQGART